MAPNGGDAKRSGEEQQLRSEIENAVDPRVDLAVERTSLALERTHLAWARTTMVFLTAGFAIDKGFEAIHEERLASGKALIKHGHFSGMVFTISGTVLMIIVSIFYLKRYRELERMKGAVPKVIVPGAIISLVIIFIGFLLIYLMEFA